MSFGFFASSETTSDDLNLLLFSFTHVRTTDRRESACNYWHSFHSSYTYLFIMCIFARKVVRLIGRSCSDIKSIISLVYSRVVIYLPFYFFSLFFLYVFIKGQTCFSIFFHYFLSCVFFLLTTRRLLPSMTFY